MYRMQRALFAAAATLVVFVSATVAAQSYHLFGRVPLGDAQGWDYLAFEPTMRLVYVSHERDVLVVDPAKGKVVGRITPTPGVHGIAFAPAAGRGFISNGDDSSVTIFALDTRRILGRVKTTGGDPDAIVFDSASGRIFTMNADGKNSTAIDAASGKVVGTMALGGGPEFAVADGRGHLYANIETTSELVEIDTHALTILRRWPLAPCATPSALSMDRARRRLFVGCRNHVLAVVDADSGRVLQSMPIGDHVDASVFDASQHLVFMSNGDGTLNVMAESEGDSLVARDVVKTQAGAKTMAMDPVTHDLYLATASRAVSTGGKGKIIPGTFTLLHFTTGSMRASLGARAIAPTSLVVLIAVDQMRPDYFARYAGQFTGGFAYIRAHSAFFANGQQNHANTETAPGHSTMLSGREPVHTGIVSNDRGVPDFASPLIEATGPGASPQRFLGTTLFDWMLANDSGSRVLSVSRKDRGAILPVGRAKGSVFWYAGGAFTTSRYYADTLPAWVHEFNARHGADALAGTRWELLRAESDYREADSMPYEHGGSDFTFPHALPATAKEMRDGLSAYPWMDSLTLAFAVDGVHQLALGQRQSIDLLSISLSTTDAVGHAYGPDSREMHDHLLRLDKWLGVFLDSLHTMVPEREIVLALTADHGVTSFPEYLASVQHVAAGRISLDGVARSLSDSLTARYHIDFDVQFSNGLLSADTAALRSRGLDVDSLARALATDVRSRGGIARVYTPRSLSMAPAREVTAVRWRNAIPRDVGWLVAVVARPNFVWSNSKLSAEHGTMSDIDVGVPIAFAGAGIVNGTYGRVARTVDIAPTLASYLGLRPTEHLDGEILPVINATARSRMALRNTAPARPSSTVAAH